jgi:hypothetical protein
VPTRAGASLGRRTLLRAQRALGIAVVASVVAVALVPYSDTSQPGALGVLTGGAFFAAFAAGLEALERWLVRRPQPFAARRSWPPTMPSAPNPCTPWRAAPSRCCSSRAAGSLPPSPRLTWRSCVGRCRRWRWSHSLCRFARVAISASTPGASTGGGALRPRDPRGRPSIAGTALCAAAPAGDRARARRRPRRWRSPPGDPPARQRSRAREPDGCPRLS